MTLKFDCGCGLRIAFDVEPENGRMPMSLNCPSCNADITALADREIAAQLAAATPAAPAKPGMRIVRHTEHAAPASTPASAPSATMAAPPPPPPAAMSQAPKPPAAPVKPAKPEIRPPGFLSIHGFKLAGLAIVGVLGFWIWFSFFGSKPRVIFSLQATEAAPFLDARMLDQERLLVLTTQRISVRNTTTDTDVWSAEIKMPDSLKNPEKPKNAPRFAEELMENLAAFMAHAVYNLRLSGKSAWVRIDSKVFQYDVANGKKLSETAIPQPMESQHADATGWLFVSEGTNNQQVLTRIDFASGKAITAKFIPPPQPALRFSEEPGDGPFVEQSVLEFAGTAVLQAKLLEANVTSKKPDNSGKASVVEKENLRAGDSDAAGAEFMRNNQEYASEDLSKYEVTIRRPFGGTIWKGNVAGRPILIPLTTLDLLIAGKTVMAFDRSGTKLWQAAMGNTVADHYFSSFGDDREGAPAIEAGGRIYVIDRGTLHALNARNGEAAWRLPTVGATEVVHASDGVYVATTSAGPEAMNLANPRDGRDVKPIVLCANPSDGRVRWQADWVGDHVVVSGKFVFGWRSGSSRLDEMAAAMNQSDVPTMLHLNKLDPSNGKTDWHWNKKGDPDTVAAIGNRILIHKPKEILVLGFKAL